MSINQNQKMKGWDELGVVDTIYEEEDQEHNDLKSISCATSTTISPISHHSYFSEFSLSLSLHSRVEEWSLVHGCKTDVIILFDDQVYHLHKEPLISRSRYLHHRLSESAEITVTPPPKITPDTFTAAILFCYDSFVNLTPANLAAVRITADWLKMDIDNGSNDGSLMWLTEVYFRQEVAGDAINAKQVMSSSIQMLPDITAALIVVRCVEVLDRERIDDQWMEELLVLDVEDFQVVVDSMRTWFEHDHDLLYQIIDCYLQNHNESITEETKNSICQSINCNKLSHNKLLHLVRNPHLPLRFIVQAMLIDQLQTRHDYLNLSSNKHLTNNNNNNNNNNNPTTLGCILKHDSAFREATHLRSAMEVTSFRIESLERDVEGMRRKLRWTQEKKAELEKERASSFRVLNGKPGKRGENSKNEESVFVKLMNGVKNVFKSRSYKEGEEIRVGHQRKR